MKVLHLLTLFLVASLAHEGHEEDFEDSPAIASIIQKHWEKFESERKALRGDAPEGERQDIDLSYQCIHDKIFTEPVEAVDTGAESHHEKRQAQPIRFLPNTDKLAANNDVGFACYAVGDVVTVNGAQFTCRTQDLLTPTLSSFLSNSVIPATLEIFAKVLTLKTPVTGNLKLAAQTCTNGLTIPAQYVNTGVAGTDYIVFTMARPAGNDGIVAFASSCQSVQNGRPVAGYINFNPVNFARFLPPNAVTQFSFAGAVKVAVHEMTHALGFASNYYTKYINANGQTYATTTTQTVTGTSAAGNAFSVQLGKLITPTLIQKARTHYGCTTLDGVLLEDNGGAGTAGSHWELRVVGSEYMAGYINPRMPISVLTLALFQDMGWYTPDFTKAEYLGWGKGQGCAFVNNRCESSWAGIPGYFCTQTDTVDKCDAERTGFGRCQVGTYNAALPPYYQHFANALQGGSNAAADYCPYVISYSNRYCDDSSINIAGQSYGPGSRCWPSAANAADLTTNNAVPLCLQTRCIDVNTLQVNVNNQWFTCPTAGGALSAAGKFYSCPPASLFCTDAAPIILPTGNGVPTSQAPTQGVPTQQPNPTQANPTTQISLPTAAVPTVVVSPASHISIAAMLIVTLFVILF